MTMTARTKYKQLEGQAAQRLADLERDVQVDIQVGSATCEHAAGSLAVYEELRKHITASGRKDIRLWRTGCTGRCSREPIVGIRLKGHTPVLYQKVDVQSAHSIFSAHVLQGEIVEGLVLDRDHAEAVDAVDALICNGEHCDRTLDFDPRETMRAALRAAGRDESQVRVRSANCFGLCTQEQQGKGCQVLLRPENALYRANSAEDLRRIVNEHLVAGKALPDLQSEAPALSKRFFERYGGLAFFNRQTRVALRNAGVVDPESLDDYIRHLGFDALAKVLDGNDPDAVIRELSKARLRGRGGGGYPTGQKWAMARAAEGGIKYVICNADEGDPGAFMDRSMLESDPFSILEGMLIAGFAIGAQQGFLYVRAEYPLAIRRLENAMQACREAGLLGENILGTDFHFDLEIRLGAGAFVCGEETALIHSIEGERGQPRIRPPYPSERGLWGRPTVINNVETFANIPVLLTYGGEWFARIGTEHSGGTKVFALAGKVRHTGLVEVPMGTTLRRVVFDIGGGIPGDKKIKAIQTGGPAGGCIPERWLDTPVDFDSLTAKGSIMGSGGMIVLDEDSCMVDVAKFFMGFSQDESCGKCTPCREGTTRILEILERITEGQGTERDLQLLERLALLMKRTSLCGLGRAAPNPVLSTLREFREEFEAHVRDKRCPAGCCKALLHYEIDPECCVGCTVCARQCPVACISGERRKAHTIDQARCIKCGRCFEVCRFEAVRKK